MKKVGFIFIILIICVIGAVVLFVLPKGKRVSRTPEASQIETIPAPTQQMTPMQLTSFAFSHNGAIPAKYTCDGENINPPLEISGVPEGTKSLALIFDDPDAPAGTWVHWTLWNIDPSTTTIEENSVPPSAVEGKTSFGSAGYGGPCPPSGTHRYFFKLYALDTMLDLDSSASKKDLLSAMDGHILAQAELMGTYMRRR